MAKRTPKKKRAPRAMKESGAAGRKRRRQEVDQARREAALRGAERRSVYGDIPPAKDAAGRMERAHAIASRMLDEVVTDAVIDEDKRRKQATDLLKAIAGLAPKSLYAARIAELERTVYGKRREKGKSDAEDGLEDLGDESPDPLSRLEQDVKSRVVDLYCLVKRRLTGETLFTVGGRWDRTDRCYLDERPQRGKVLLLNEAQVLGEPGRRVEEGPAWALKSWIEARRAKRARVVELVLDGARGSGKTHLGTLALWLIAIAFPEAECWLISPANTRRAEIERIVADHIPAAWKTGWSERDLSYALPNQSVVRFLGADDEDGLKRGGFEVALLNEAQLVTSQAYSNTAAGVRNLSGRPKGLLILAHNYASKIKGEWTNDHLDKIEAGAINAKRYKLDPRLNAAIDADVLDDVDGLVRSVRADLADLDSLGIRKRLGDYATPAFRPAPVAKGGHIGSPPPRVVGIDGRTVSGWRDVTREQTAKKTETENGYPIVVSLDFQRRPGCVGTVWKLYEREDLRVVYHAIKCIVAGDNEDDLCDRVDDYLATLGLTTRDALAVCDSTGRFQNAPHTKNTKPSHDIVSEWHFPVVAPRRARVSGKGWMNANPLVEESLAQFYDLCTANRILIAEGEATEWLVECLRRCKTKKRGGTLRLDDSNPGYSHPVDTARYLTWYFEPRRGPATPPVKFDAEKFDRLRAARADYTPR